jgi:predicted PurR-regulated permease PerM
MLERLVLPPWLRISLALPLLTLNLWVLKQLLLPLAPFPALFLTAALLAFLLDLPTRWLIDQGLPRALALLLVLGLTLGLVALAAVWLVPRLAQQLDELIHALPRWLVQGETVLAQLQQWASRCASMISPANCSTAPAASPASSASSCWGCWGRRSVSRSTP